MDDLISRIQRELPDTDKNRYDIAYERGRAQARSAMLFGGLLVGAVAGALATFLLDPARGAGRRAQLASRATGIRNDLARTTSGRVEDLQNRAKGAAIEAGLREPEDFGEAARRAERDAAAVGNGTAVAAFSGGAWDAEDRERQAASEGHGAG
ncbi:MAG TPA: YtxH domain-containing protein [Candidatus Limnocylindrales bacterium]